MEGELVVAKALQKPGKEGPLFFYRITYTGREHDPSITPMTWSTWAYNLEHAEDKFYDTDDGEGWEILSIARVLDSTSQHRAIQHEPRHAMETMEEKEVTHAYVLLREVGKKKWLYLDGKGGEAATRVRAARYTIKQATEIAQDIMTDNPGTWEAKVLPIE